MRRLVSIVMAMSLTAAGESVAAEGVATLDGRQVLRVRGCGTGNETVAQTLALDTDGRWSAQTDDGILTGRYVTTDAKGRSITLDFDDLQAAVFLAGRIETASALCGASVSVATAVAQRFLLKLDRTRTKAKMMLKYLVTGSTPGTPRRLRYTLVARGVWQDRTVRSCAELGDCFMPCGDDPCIQACYDSLSPEGQGEFFAISQCVAAACAPDFSDMCVEQALAGACADEQATCLT